MKRPNKPFQEKIIKPWGKEIIFTPKELGRTGKILSIRSKKRLSFQYHDNKEETLCLFSGSVLLLIENDDSKLQKINMEPQKGYTILPKQKHRLEALEDSIVLEISSQEKGNTIRLKDDYNRGTETEDERNKPNRNWHGETN
ncbi:hypothetical protein A3C75_01895 [Candidatus Giovannonibacteria bacterium RIFCSPHIGHO2_02_FULL_44_31]|nr:MAG: hypothetical protein A3C75_01895 [Candidatus Giovannonibacteria bacterium RIFCSPHIGHO2_02_FULL_44_31]